MAPVTDWNPTLRFVPWPGALPRAKRQGRVVLVDIAFAWGERYDAATRPFITEAAEDLVMWIDHHPHPEWEHYVEDPRFVLVDKGRAPACPELVTEARAAVMVEREVETVLAHGDFDGCLSAVKVALRGHEPYARADEDARAVDAPGRGFSLSDRGRRLADAFAHGSHALAMSDYIRLLERCAHSLIAREPPGKESGDLAAQIDTLAEAERRLIASVLPRADAAFSPHPNLIVLRLDEPLARSVKKALLQELESRATVAVIDEAGFITAASFHELDRPLNGLPGLNGGASYAWGRADLDEVLDEWIASREE